MLGSQIYPPEAPNLNVCDNMVDSMYEAMLMTDQRDIGLPPGLCASVDGKLELSHLSNSPPMFIKWRNLQMKYTNKNKRCIQHKSKKGDLKQIYDVAAWWILQAWGQESVPPHKQFIPSAKLLLMAFTDQASSPGNPEIKRCPFVDGMWQWKCT